MKVNIKNLSGVVHSLEMEPWETIEEVKLRLAMRIGCAPAALKIVCRGKPTTDDLSIDSLRLRENETLVVMILRAKPLPRQEVDASIPPVGFAKSEEIPSQAPSSVDPHIKELINMGFRKEESQVAFKAAYGNFERAVEYLINGLPSSLPNSSSQQLQAGLQELKKAFKQNPATLPILIQELTKTNPALLEYVTNHPEQLAASLNEDQDEEENEQNDDDIEELEIDELGEQGDVEEGEQEIEIGGTDAIHRLMELGFSRAAVVEAYLSCDRNEQLAANLLFERLANGDEFPSQGDDSQ